MLKLPELFVSNTGLPITTPDAWRTIRRPELLELFRTHVYGRTPPSANHPQLSFTIDDESPTAMDGQATRRQITLHFTGPHGVWKFPLILFIPNTRTKPAPCFLYISIGDRTRIDPTRQIKSPQWPAELIVQRGYAAAAFQVDHLSPNVRPGTTPDFKLSVHGKFDAPAARQPDAWGTIAAWAWGASRAMDYLATDPDIDAKRIAVAGHSRAGKTALWAAAQDERFALAISAQSGCTGAALSRGKENTGAEMIADITQGFPHWFCDNYKKFANHEDQLPLDQHMLLALIAPRLLYVSSATEDTWCSPPSEFAACLHAQPAWQLHNLPTNLPPTLPAPNSPLHTAPIAHHLRPGPHALTTEDWTHYLNYADKYL